MNSITIKRETTIGFYKDLHRLFEDIDPDFLDNLSPEEDEALGHLLDFEDYAFIVVDYQTIGVVYCGEMTSCYTLDEFKKLTMQLLNEDT